MLREATIDDLEGVKTLSKSYIADSGEALTISDENFLKMYICYLCDPDSHMYVLEMDGTLTGFAVLSVRQLMFEEKIAKLEWFYVHPCLRGTGAGLKLAEFLRDLSVQNGARIIMADTMIRRFAGVFRNMFQKIGFEQPGYTMVYRS